MEKKNHKVLKIMLLIILLTINYLYNKYSKKLYNYKQGI